MGERCIGTSIGEAFSMGAWISCLWVGMKRGVGLVGFDGDGTSYFEEYDE